MFQILPRLKIGGALFLSLVFVSPTLLAKTKKKVPETVPAESSPVETQPASATGTAGVTGTAGQPESAVSMPESSGAVEPAPPAPVTENEGLLREGDIPRKVEEAYQATENLTANFVQKTRMEMLVELVIKEGKMTFHKGDSPRGEAGQAGRWLIEYKKPEAKQYISDGHTLWVYRPQDKEVEVYENIADLVSQEGLAFLGGLANLQAVFEATAKKKLQGEDYQLTLRPKQKGVSPKGSFKKIVLTVRPPRFLVTEAILYPESTETGSVTRYFFSEIKTNTRLKTDLFQFKPPDGVKELRP
ncbi:MAG: outer membrane lipoprotein carrier protein LolA [Deltaproteobacteria bacterium]|nr:outer membrane lipoprotein carrier protein LolA [Deltaproteobacteria bacterium]